MNLANFWFLLIGFLFTGYFVLEGFDFGVGALLRRLGHDDTGRRVLINTIGPVWDANETWLIVAVAAMFAAFPAWYAATFSTFYLPVLVILCALIVRGLAFEYRGKVDDPAWRRRWDACIIVGSVLPPLLWGVFFANLVRGVPLDKEGNFAGSLLDLLSPYALLGGLTMLLLFVCHGAIFVALRTVGAVRHEARGIGARVGLGAGALLTIFGLSTAMTYGGGWALMFAVLSPAALIAALVANTREREGWAFGFTAGTVAGLNALLFAALWPDLLRAVDPALSITIENGSSTPLTLRTMTWIALAATPLVLVYQGWSYWVFRKRIGRGSIPPNAPHDGAARSAKT
jgi:cytochrome bd ubiquinol oxidase subunit II